MRDLYWALRGACRSYQITSGTRYNYDVYKSPWPVLVTLRINECVILEKKIQKFGAFLDS